MGQGQRVGVFEEYVKDIYTGFHASGVDPGFLEVGSNPSRGGSFAIFYLIFHKFPHKTETRGPLVLRTLT